MQDLRANRTLDVLRVLRNVFPDMPPAADTPITHQ